ncbi:MAG: phosphatidate cytidylyltransferase [Lachnospiraceae bacterium]|nr:phosphatidate cytidylyltransferase [Lachnospiraceae bacterium]
MFKERLISGILLVLIAIGAIYVGGWVLWGVLLLISVIGMAELERVFEMHLSVPAALCLLAAIGYYLLIKFGQESYTVPLLLGLMLALLITFVIGYPRYEFTKLLVCFLALFYVAMTMCCLYRIRILSGGVYLVWLAFLGAWGSDTCAYCVGRLIGKHKAFPVLSPKKSWEGCVGGVLGAALLGFVFALVFEGKITAVGNPLLACPVICACASILSQFGDLAASGIKRQHNIKDYGKLIPGHGGVLDRFDSVIFTAPATYLLLSLVFGA